MRGVDDGHVPGKIETGRWYDIKIELQGARIRCWLDGQLIHDIKNADLKSMYAVAGLKRDTHEIILKVVNAGEQAQETALDLQGAGRLADTAQVITLAGARDDENTFDAPNKISPKVSIISGVKAHVNYVFPPCSVTVLRLKQLD